MIISFKIFESVNVKPKKGDYVIVTYNDNIIPYIGKITYVNKKKSIPYLVEWKSEWTDKDFNFYEYGLQEPFLATEYEEIKYWSKNKEELEQFLLNNKFNI